MALTSLSVLSGGVHDLGKSAVLELLLNWLAPFLTEDEKLIWLFDVSLLFYPTSGFQAIPTK